MIYWAGKTPLAFPNEGGMVVDRRWEELPDGRLFWKHEVRAWDVYILQKYNFLENVNERTPRLMRAMDGTHFDPRQHSVRLEDFVFLQQELAFVHLPTSQRLTSRQMNHRVFKDRTFWPIRIRLAPDQRRVARPDLSGDAKIVKPTQFIMRHSRVPLKQDLERAFNLVKHVA